MSSERGWIRMPDWFYPKRVRVKDVWWLLFFGILYFVLWIPSPWTFTWKKAYLGPFGLPLFVIFWVLVNILCILGMIFYYAQASRMGLFKEPPELEARTKEG